MAPARDARTLPRVGIVLDNEGDIDLLINALKHDATYRATELRDRLEDARTRLCRKRRGREGIAWNPQ
jgi:hypothetical protein